MNIKKIMLTIIVTAALLIMVTLILVNIYFFRTMPPVSVEPKEKGAAEETAETTYNIPANAIPASQSIEDIINSANERKKNLEDRELEAQNTRNAIRAEAFARQKELEASLLRAESQKEPPPPMPKKEPLSPSADELKALEKKGIVSY